MARYDDDEDHIDMRPLLRITAWGACAAVALGAAVVAGRTDIGEQRAGAALAALRTAPADLLSNPMAVLATRPAGNEARLADSVRSLTADRDRLATRVATLERSINDLTGSISRNAPRASSGAAPSGPAIPRTDDKADMPAPAQVAAASPNDVKPADQPGVGLPANVPLPRPAPLPIIQSYVQSYVNATPAPAAAPPARVAEAPANAAANPAVETPAKEFAIELAFATNVNALRARWGTIKTAHAALLGGLQPLVSVRESSRPGFTEFHLVAGPVADADAAARLCAALSSARVPCQPAPFDGQRLDLR